jgi:hypothetical protein
VAAHARLGWWLEEGAGKHKRLCKCFAVYIGLFNDRRRCFSVSIAIQNYLAPEKGRRRNGGGPIAALLFDNALAKGPFE